MVNLNNIDHIDPYLDGDLRNLKHMMDDEYGVGYTKHSHNHMDQKRIYYIKLKKQMQKDEQLAREGRDVEMESADSDSDDKYKKKKKANKSESPVKKGRRNK
jgi:hypothetical protein